MSLADELLKLDQLRQSGALNDDEFALAKAKVLNGSPDGQPAVPPPPAATAVSPATQEQQTRQWDLVLHLSLLAGLVVPLAGLLLPIIIWQVEKVELPGLDAHGKNALNWIISELVYAILFGLLLFVVLPLAVALLIALGVVGVIFPIVAAVKANNGKVWKYPFAIMFLK